MYPNIVGTGFTEDEIITRPYLLDLLNGIFDYSNFTNPNKDLITWILNHDYFTESKKHYPEYKCLTYI